MIAPDFTVAVRLPPADIRELSRRLRRAARRMGVPATDLAGIAVHLVDDAEIQRLNLKHMGHDRPTDVLSFPARPDTASSPTALTADEMDAQIEADADDLSDETATDADDLAEATAADADDLAEATAADADDLAEATEADAEAAADEDDPSDETEADADAAADADDLADAIATAGQGRATPPHVGLGDIVLSWDAVCRQAGRRPPLDEATVLLIHGLAHLLGHDHKGRRDGRAMHRRELRGLAAARVADIPRPYSPR